MKRLKNNQVSQFSVVRHYNMDWDTEFFLRFTSVTDSDKVYDVEPSYITRSECKDFYAIGIDLITYNIPDGEYDLQMTYLGTLGETPVLGDLNLLVSVITDDTFVSGDDIYGDSVILN